MKIIKKITELLSKSNYNNNSVFDIAFIIKENVPVWITIDNMPLGIDFFQVIDIQKNKLTFCCFGTNQKPHKVSIRINKNKIYISKFGIM